MVEGSDHSHEDGSGFERQAPPSREGSDHSHEGSGGRYNDQMYPR